MFSWNLIAKTPVTGWEIVFWNVKERTKQNEESKASGRIYVEFIENDVR